MPNGRGTALVVILLIAYFFAIIPHLVHSSFRDAGVVLDSKEVNPEDLPRWLDAYVSQFGESSVVALRVGHNGPNVTYAILTDKPQAEGDLVLFRDPIIRHVTDWRTLNFLDFEFDEFLVADVEPAGENILSRVEISLHYPEKRNAAIGLINGLSIAAWLVGPIVVFLYVPYVLFGGIRLWGITGTICLYVYGVLFLAVISSGQIAVPTILFLVLGILTLHLWRYERSQKGRETLDRIWSYRRRLPDRL